MINSVKEQNIALNRIWKLQEEVYQSYASYSGLSQVSFWILYSLCETDRVYTQHSIAELWCFPRQSVNSAIANLIKKEIVCLEQLSGARNSKAIRLTNKGLNLCQCIIMPLIQAELKTLLKLTEYERNLFVQICKKQVKEFKDEVKLLYKYPKDFRGDPIT